MELLGIGSLAAIFEMAAKYQINNLQSNGKQVL